MPTRSAATSTVARAERRAITSVDEPGSASPAPAVDVREPGGAVVASRAGSPPRPRPARARRRSVRRRRRRPPRTPRPAARPARCRAGRTAPTASPAASRGSQAAFCSSEPASRTASPASTVPRHGPGATPAPSARAITCASTRPETPSRPSCSSGTSTASQPCSPAAFHSAAGCPSPSVVLDHAANGVEVEPLGEVAAHSRVELALVVGECEEHDPVLSWSDYRGRPSTRSAVTLRCTCDEPPQIVTDRDHIAWACSGRRSRPSTRVERGVLAEDVVEDLPQVLERLRPLQLRHRRLEPEVAALLDLGEHVHRVQPQALQLGEHAGELAAHHRVVVSRPSRFATAAISSYWRRNSVYCAIPDAPRSNDSSSIAVRQPSPISPSDVGGRHAGVVEEHLAELARPAHLLERAGVHARLVHVDEQHRDAAVALRAGFGADQREDLVAVHGVGGPHLLPVDDEVVAVADAPGGERGEVGPRAGLGEALAPDHLVAQQRSDDLLLLRVGADAP